MSARAACGCGWVGTYPTLARAAASADMHRCPRGRGARRTTRRHTCPTCGHQATYDNATATEARYWFRKHSCEKQQALDARAARAEARESKIDRTPKPCHHKVADHQHGTRACYVLDRCRCQPCARANAEAEQWRTRQQAYGRYDRYVDADPIRAHVRQLQAAGVGLKVIARRSGVAHGTLWKLMYGRVRPDGTQTPSRRVLRDTATRLQALDPTDTGLLADGATLTMEASRSTHLRLQALVALGWSMSELGRRLGMLHVRNVIPVVTGDRAVTVATARKTRTLFDELCMTLPPAGDRWAQGSAARSRNLARTRGWLPPLALPDLDDTDLDTTSPDDVDETAVLRRLDGDKTVRLTTAEAAFVVERWRASGRTAAECERVTGLNPHRYPTAEQAS